MTGERDTYYSEYYKKTHRAGFQGWGNSLIDKIIEKKAVRFPGMKILEIGASSGEHLDYVSVNPIWEEYVCLDLNPGVSDPIMFEKLSNKTSSKFSNLSFIRGDAECLPFSDDKFDLVISACLLAHVNNPEKVLIEMRRVVKSTGQIVIAMPSDPGILNRLVKLLITYPKMKRLGIQFPRLEYAREHRNCISNLIELIKWTFRDDKFYFSFFPFRFRSWNSNLVVTLDCRVLK